MGFRGSPGAVFVSVVLKGSLKRGASKLLKGSQALFIKERLRTPYGFLQGLSHGTAEWSVFGVETRITGTGLGSNT